MSNSANLPYTVPVFKTAVERDVVYARRTGYWTESPVGEKGAVRRLFPLLLHKRPLELMMDIYTPEGDPSARRPLLLMMHGGSFFIGNKGEAGQSGWCEYFASLGYVAASVDYRLGFLPTRRDVAAAEDRAFEDADEALSFLLGREDLRIDPDKVFAAGTSAGGILALRLAFRPAGEHPRIRAVGDLWGAVHDLGVLEHARTAIFSYQSSSDPIMPYGRGYPFKTGRRLIQPPTQWFSEVLYGTAAVHEKACALGLRAEHHECTGPYHRLHLDGYGRYTDHFYQIRDGMAAFFAEEFRA